MEDENQNMMTPLLDDEEHSVTTPVAEEAISLTEGTTPQSKMSSGLSQRQKQQILSVPKNPSSTGRVEHEEEESKTSQTRHELGSADMCLVLVYAQWIWPSMVNSGFVFAHYADDEERWFASMIGNALFFACLWWIKTGNSTKTVPAEETSFAEDEKKKSARGGPQQQQQQQQHIVRTDILPTVVWGVLPPLCNFLSEYPETIGVLALAVFLPFCIMLLQHSRRNGLKSTMASCCNSCSRCFARAAAPFERAIPFKRVFKRLEEDHFEDLRARESEDAKELEEQKERLSHLEDDFRSLSKDDSERIQRKHGCIICVLLLLAVAEVIYASFFLIRPAYTRPEHRVGHRVAVRRSGMIDALDSVRESTDFQNGGVLSDYQSGDEKLGSFGDETSKNVPVSQIIVDHHLEPSRDEVINPSGVLAMKK